MTGDSVNPLINVVLILRISPRLYTTAGRGIKSTCPPLGHNVKFLQKLLKSVPLIKVVLRSLLLPQNSNRIRQKINYFRRAQSFRSAQSGHKVTWPKKAWSASERAGPHNVSQIATTTSTDASRADA